MSGRIVTLQRQVRELGRLRAGITAENAQGRKFPKASRTWVVTSPNRSYVEAAAVLWGGLCEPWQPQGQGAAEWRVITGQDVIAAILPPNDPINQSYEMWTGGGCQRRCDGENESRSAKPCLCRAQFGEDFHTVPLLDQAKKPQRCSMTTRLSLFLPDLPDIGVWRVESKGYWPGVHLTGYVDMIKGLVGPQAMVPVLLGIEPRTKVRDGRTSQYIEVVVSLRERTSFGAILEAPRTLAVGGPADAKTIDAGPERAAIGTAPTEPDSEAAEQERGPVDWPARIREASTMADLDRVGKLIGLDPQARQSGALRTLWSQRALQLRPAVEEPERTEFDSAEFDEEPPVDDQPAAVVGQPVAMSVDDWKRTLDGQSTVEDLRELWPTMKADPVGKTTEVTQHWWRRKREIDGNPPAVAAKPAGAEQEPDRDDMWSAILRLAAEIGWSTSQVSARFREEVGVDVSSADGFQLRSYRDYLKTNNKLADAAVTA